MTPMHRWLEAKLNWHGHDYGCYTCHCGQQCPEQEAVRWMLETLVDIGAVTYTLDGDWYTLYERA